MTGTDSQLRDWCPDDLNLDCVVNVQDQQILFDNWGTCPGFDHLPTPESFETLLAQEDITNQQWDDFIDAVTHGSEQDRENHLCWMIRRLSGCETCPQCPDDDPFDH
jgi:hypothetical protein